jgi:hypothetical protein
MVPPSYLDPSTVEWCERCRCKTWHLPDPQTNERICEWAAQHEAMGRRPATVVVEQYLDESCAYDAPLGVQS